MSNQPAYRLELVLERRDEAKKDAAKAVLAAQEALRLQLVKLAQIEESRRQVDVRKAKATQDFQDLLMKPGTAILEESQRHDWYQKAQDAEAVRIDGEITKQKRVIWDHEAAVEAAKEALGKASQELEAIVKHKEKWAKGVKHDADVKEQNTQEELGEVMWLQQQREAQAQARQRGGQE